MAKRTDFFISYTKADRQWAEWIAWTLEAADYTTLIQAWDFGPGTNFVLKMNDAVRSCKQMVMVLSKDYLRSGFASSEWAAGFADDPEGARKRLLPVRVGETGSHPLLKALVYADLVGVTETEARQRLLDALQPRLKPRQAPAFPGQGPPGAGSRMPRPVYPGDPGSPSIDTDEPRHDVAAEAAEKLFQSVVSRPVAEANHYAEAAQLLTNGKLVPFLGLGVHFEVDDNAWGKKWSPESGFFPSPREYGNYLASAFLDESERVETGMELARVYQFLEETRGPFFVKTAVHHLYNRDYPVKTAHAFFASLNSVIRASGRGKPVPLIVTANLDDVLEETFRMVNEPFSVVSYISRGGDKGRLLFRSPQGEVQVLKTAAQVRKAATGDATMILKLHGGVDRRDPEREWMVLTENEVVSYFSSPAALELIPALFNARAGNARFLFLGYSLRDWNIRFLLDRIWSMQRQDMSWAVLFNTSRVTKTLWEKRGVEILDVAIEAYLAGLANEIASLPGRATDAAGRGTS